MAAIIFPLVLLVLIIGAMAYSIIDSRRRVRELEREREQARPSLTLVRPAPVQPQPAMQSFVEEETVVEETLVPPVMVDPYAFGRQVFIPVPQVYADAVTAQMQSSVVEEDLAVAATYVEPTPSVMEEDWRRPAPEPVYSPPEPTYSAPEPSYSAPDPTPSSYGTSNDYTPSTPDYGSSSDVCSTDTSSWSSND